MSLGCMAVARVKSKGLLLNKLSYFLPRMETADALAEPALFRRTKLNVDFDSSDFETRQVHAPCCGWVI